MAPQQKHVIKSPYPDVAIPDVDFASFILSESRVARSKDKPALIDGPTGAVITHGELARQSIALANGLYQLGLAPGDVIAIYSPNHIEYALALLAAMRIGVIVTTANPTYTAEELVFQLTDSRARLLITIPDVLANAEIAVKQCPLVRHVYLFGSLGAGGRAPLRTLHRYSLDFPRSPMFRPTDTAVICYSSGTTGRPKGVELTHRNLVSNIVCMHAQDVPYLRPSEVFLGVLPMFHCYCLVVVLFYSLWLDSAIVVMPRFDLSHMLSHIERYKVSWLHIVPPIVIGLAKSPLVEGRDLSSVRIVFSGAAPLGADVEEAARKRLPAQVVVKQGYGMTELSPLSHVNPSGKVRGGTIGVLIPNEEALIVDPDTGAPLPPGSEGELWVRGPNVMKGYLNNAAATAATIVSGEGWLRTGDIARVDADGYFSITDRLKELIKYKGLQVAPAELEAVLLTHPGVADAAVIPVPDVEAGELPRAYVVLKQAGGKAEEDKAAKDIAAFVEKKVAPHKKLRGGVVVIKEIPKSASGKILRRVLRDSAVNKSKL